MAQPERPEGVDHHRGETSGVRLEAAQDVDPAGGRGAGIGQDDTSTEHLHGVPRRDVHGRRRQLPAGGEHVSTGADGEYSGDDAGGRGELRHIGRRR